MIAGAEPRTTLAQRGEAVGHRDGDTRRAVDSPRARQLDLGLDVDVAVDELCEGAGAASVRGMYPCRQGCILRKDTSLLRMHPEGT